MALPAPAKFLLDSIGEKEAPRGYNTVFGNKMNRMPKQITSMTVDEVIKQGNWRYKQFGSSAAGRYQFMEKTLKSLKAQLNLTGREVMTPDMQDRLGLQLLRNRGYDKFITGRMSVIAFGLQLAQEWASFPVLSAMKGDTRQIKRGQSYYAGDGLNKALISADDVEDMLEQTLAMANVRRFADDGNDPTLIDAPSVEVATPGPSKLSKLAAFFKGGGHPPVTATRPGLRPGGDAALWDVQSKLRDLSYYTKGKPDGLDGPLTRDAVAAARKDNGLGDGGIDATFLAALVGMSPRPVSVERLTMPVTEAAKQRPEVFNPVKWMMGLGLGSIGVGSVDGSGLLDNIQNTTSQASTAIGTVQSAFGTIAGIVDFVVVHKSWFFIGLGLYVMFRAVSIGLDAWIKVRKAFF